MRLRAMFHIHQRTEAMKCKICGCLYSSPSFGGPGVCPACDCGIHPDTVKLRTAQARIAALDADIANWKRLYDRRGLALARPCIACGHVPAAIKPMSQSDREGEPK